MRIGIGYDIHRLEEGLELTLGGVRIPHKLGLKGHSDADVLIHSVCDSLLGASSLGDIGKHFPDNDLAYKNIKSTELLRESYRMVRNEGFLLENLDVTLFAQMPSFSSYKTAMEKNIAAIIDVNIKQINVKATTTEGLGVIGKNKGMAAMCIALLK